MPELPGASAGQPADLSEAVRPGHPDSAGHSGPVDRLGSDSGHSGPDSGLGPGSGPGSDPGSDPGLGSAAGSAAGSEASS